MEDRERRCPHCGATIGLVSVCPQCNGTPEGIALFDPKHFVWLAPLFSFAAPAWLAGLNWGRLGYDRRKWAWIIGGTSALVAFMVGVTLLPESLLGPAGKMATWLVHVPLGMLIRRSQQALFDTHLALGGKKAALWKEVLVGMVPPAVAIGALHSIVLIVPLDPGERGLRLLRADRCVEAETELRKAMRLTPDAPVLNFNLALALACQDSFESARTEMARYMQARPANAEAYAAMASFWITESPEQAYRLATTADSLEPGVTKRLLGIDPESLRTIP